MGTRLQNKNSMGIAPATNSSLDSLSFSDLLSVQDQQSKSPNIRANQTNEQNPEFEFGPAPIAHNLNKTSSADKLISNGQLLPQEFLCQWTQSQVTNQPCSKRSLPSSHSISKGSSDNYIDCGKVSDKPSTRIRNSANKTHTAPSSWFGRKLFQSFVSPCRDCRAAQPTAIPAPG